MCFNLPCVGARVRLIRDLTHDEKVIRAGEIGTVVQEHTARGEVSVNFPRFRFFTNPRVSEEMLRRAPRHALLALTQQATKALATLHQEIAQREQELTVLKGEAARWQGVVRGPARMASRAVTPPRVPLPKRPRLDWDVVLAGLSASFTTREVQQKTGKPMEQVYAGLSRWVKDKKVKRVKDGYQKALHQKALHRSLSG